MNRERMLMMASERPKASRGARYRRGARTMASCACSMATLARPSLPRFVWMSWLDRSKSSTGVLIVVYRVYVHPGSRQYPFVLDDEAAGAGDDPRGAAEWRVDDRRLRRAERHAARGCEAAALWRYHQGAIREATIQCHSRERAGDELLNVHVFVGGCRRGCWFDWCKRSSE